MKKSVKLNGMIVGQYESTGDQEADLQAARQVLIDKGLLKELSQAQRAFGQAGSFIKVAKAIHDQDLTERPLNLKSLIPFAVNICFALELYLKALSSQFGKSLRGHELAKLYRHLPKAAKDVLDKAESAKRALQPHAAFSLSECLTALNDAYSQLRYVHESDQRITFTPAAATWTAELLHAACSNAIPKP